MDIIPPADHEGIVVGEIERLAHMWAGLNDKSDVHLKYRRRGWVRATSHTPQLAVEIRGFGSLCPRDLL